jgi:hypothetical protein
MSHMATINITRHGMALAAMANLLQDKAERISQAWQRYAPKRLWAGWSLDDFRAQVGEPLGSHGSIHDYAQRAELILEILAAIEKDIEPGHRSPVYSEVFGLKSPRHLSQVSRLAA